MKLTPLEIATKITINSTDDCILNWKITSLLIYCWKNNLDLIRWYELIPFEITNKIGNSSEYDAEQLGDDIHQDLMLSGMFVELMKLDDFSKGVDEKIIIKNIHCIMNGITRENIEQILKKDWGEDFKSMTLIKIKDKSKSIYDVTNYIMQRNNKDYFFERKSENSFSLKPKHSKDD